MTTYEDWLDDDERGPGPDPVLCGNCGQFHGDPDEVSDCYLVAEVTDEELVAFWAWVLDGVEDAA